MNEEYITQELKLDKSQEESIRIYPKDNHVEIEIAYISGKKYAKDLSLEELELLERKLVLAQTMCGSAEYLPFFEAVGSLFNRAKEMLGF